MADMWSYRESTTGGTTTDVAGFSVEATDGHIGKIDQATYETGSSGIVVDTGFWIFGKKRQIPAGALERIDLEEEKVYVNMTKDQIKNAPDYEETMSNDEDYRRGVGDYYGGGGRL